MKCWNWDLYLTQLQLNPQVSQVQNCGVHFYMLALRTYPHDTVHNAAFLSRQQVLESTPDLRHRLDFARYSVRGCVVPFYLKSPSSVHFTAFMHDSPPDAATSAHLPRIDDTMRYLRK